MQFGPGTLKMSAVERSGLSFMGHPVRVCVCMHMQ